MHANESDPPAEAAVRRQERFPIPHSRLGLKLARLVSGPAMWLQNRDVPSVGATIDRTIPGPASDLDVRLYLPNADGRFPTVVFFHGVHESEALVRPIRNLRFLRTAGTCWAASPRTTGSAVT